MREFSWRSIRAILLCSSVSALLLSAMPSQAQESAEPVNRGNERLIRLFSGLSPDHRVQIVTPLVRIDRGAFARVGQDTVVVTQDGFVVPVPLDHIRTVTFERDHRIQASLWGLGVGVVAGAVAGLMIGSFNCTSPLRCQNSERDGAVKWGAVTGIVGGGLGWLLGRRSVYWKPVFP